MTGDTFDGFRRVLLLTGPGLLGGCDAQQQVLVSFCEQESLGTIAPNDDRVTGFSAELALASLGSPVWSVVWDVAPDDTLLVPALSTLSAEFSLLETTVDAVRRTDVREGGCDGITGEALSLPVGVTLQGDTGALEAAGRLELIVASDHDPGLQRFETEPEGVLLSVTPADIDDTAASYAEEHDIGPFELGLDLSGKLDAARVVITLRAEQHIATVASGGLAP